VPVAVASVLLWAYEQGRLDDLIAELSAHDRGDYPPHWEPPRRLQVWRGPDTERLLDIFDVILQTDPPPWVRAAYLLSVAQKRNLPRR
jgi:hypothetical protein